MSASAIVALVFVPSAGDPGKLLARGRGGALGAPARVSYCQKQAIRLLWDDDLGLSSEYGPDPDSKPEWKLGSISPALAVGVPVWWAGDLVPEGWDRVRRVVVTGPHPGARALRLVGHWSPNLSELFAVGEELVRMGYVERIVRLRQNEVDGGLDEITSSVKEKAQGE